MKESELAFWQKTARHYTRSMDRSAPLYAAVCERIRPHLSRDMNVLELACGTGQLSFPLSPYVRLWEATDAAPAMIQEAKKRIGSSRLHFSVQDAAHLPYAPESFDAVVIANALHILPEPDRVLREIQRVLKPGGWLFAPTFVHGGGFVSYLSMHDFWVVEHALLGGRVLPLCCAACRWTPAERITAQSRSEGRLHGRYPGTGLGTAE